MTECDRCGAEGVVEWRFKTGHLLMCLHHSRMMFMQDKSRLGEWVSTGEPYDEDSLWGPILGPEDEEEKTNEYV